MDINNDGNIDLIGAGFAGVTYILYGNADGSFNEAVVLKNKKGNDLHMAYYYDFAKKAYVKDEKLGVIDKGNFAKFHDWDNDGDLDLIMSGSEGAYLFINEGNKSKPLFSSKYKKIIPAHYADALVDWDGDGLWDIVGGSKKGGVNFYKNKGKLGAPKFEEAVSIFTNEEIVSNLKNATAGQTEVAVADYNNDGKLDLIIGANTRLKTPEPKLTEKQKKEKELLLLKQSKHSEKLKKYCDDFAKRSSLTDKKEITKALLKDDTYSDLRKESMKILKELNKYRGNNGSHGYVYVSIRQ